MKHLARRVDGGVKRPPLGRSPLQVRRDGVPGYRGRRSCCGLWSAAIIVAWAVLVLIGATTTAGDHSLTTDTAASPQVRQGLCSDNHEKEVMALFMVLLILALIVFGVGFAVRLLS